jgi:hypothetical protein
MRFCNCNSSSLKLFSKELLNKLITKFLAKSNVNELFAAFMLVTNRNTGVKLNIIGWKKA